LIFAPSIDLIEEIENNLSSEKIFDVIPYYSIIWQSFDDLIISKRDLTQDYYKN